MARRLFSVLSALSLLLCAAVVVLWVRSFWSMDHVSLLQLNGTGRDVQRARAVWSGRGVVGVLAAHFTDRPVEGRPWKFLWTTADASGWQRPRGAWTRVIGFGSGRVDDPEQGYGETFVPHWFLVALLAALPTARLIRARRQRRLTRMGLCHHCGYDLRATPGRCPECGVVPAQAGRAQYHGARCAGSRLRW